MVGRVRRKRRREPAGVKGDRRQERRTKQREEESEETSNEKARAGYNRKKGCGRQGNIEHEKRTDALKSNERGKSTPRDRKGRGSSIRE